MYKAPVEEIAHMLSKVAGLDQAMEKGEAGELTPDLLSAILEEAGKFAGEAAAPLYEIGDREGASYSDGRVTMPRGWKELYTAWLEAGWNGLSGPVEAGGQGLPIALSVAVTEMWNSASMAFGIGPTLTIGTVEALHRHGSEKLQAVYLEKLTSGEWMGTMNLTEPQAGTDLAALRSRAERRDDGTYHLFGQKIFITFGEHDLTENIVHFVLARLPDAPAGNKGLSLFLVPKFIPDENGAPGLLNDVNCVGIEHKMGIHASPTCTMIYGGGAGETGEPGAVSWLVGEENNGLACMFTMMNSARLYVGIQGLGVAEAATQLAQSYANDRLQGRRPGNPADMVPIAEHPDVRRMLMTMKALTGAARAICYACGVALDLAHSNDPQTARFWNDRASLLTPMAKSFSSDIGVEVASLGIQVHGGMGYIEETGAARLYRDARIACIYEGTNGVQAMDLVGRKLSLSGGEAVKSLLSEFDAVVEDVRASNRPEFGETANALAAALADLREAAEFLGRNGGDIALYGATPFQRLFSLVAGAGYLARSALASDAAERVALARFMAEDVLADVSGLKRRTMAGAVLAETSVAILA
ncbi:acyl-CoA dehydrogenase [Aureimonas fodinaquatilis]|uniref:3-methylmercaptopropionyl-CoA dehydrogenase n=1 Tax=Aureimonas fodinaquatilis TaxID=2565783 RepID=A0A5B0E1D6_9HYPH|nr:acyl-CoA dehydrogenase [Aureimonas fodinaquatilis]KAA0972466.1 acyl-CoA dehydrogenase [Aureimonas fodinaquatilis]